MTNVPHPYVVDWQLVTGIGSLIPICSLSNRSLLPSCLSKNFLSGTFSKDLDPFYNAFGTFRKVLAPMCNATCSIDDGPGPFPESFCLH